MRAEISSLRRLETESTRLYEMLQTSVDKQLQQVGFLPDPKYGMDADGKAGQNGGSKNGHHASAASVSVTNASVKQETLIAKIAKEQKFTAENLDGIAKRLFGSPLAELDRKQTSSFITELLLIAGPPRFRKASGRPAEANRATA